MQTYGSSRVDQSSLAADDAAVERKPREGSEKGSSCVVVSVRRRAEGRTK